MERDTTIMNYQNYALGKWITGEGEGAPLFNAITGERIGRASSKGLDFNEMMTYARKVGGPTLRKMTFQERGLMLKALALHLHSVKDKFYELSYVTGATKIDSWIDIEGGIGNLFANSSLRRQFPDLPFYVDGEAARLSKGGTFIGHHIMVPREGVAVHINAFNFPIWGMLEKIAVNLMAGVPAIVKPATLTCYLTELMVREIIATQILPEGSLQLICGSANGILDHVCCEDVVTFTGSASTGKMLKAHSKLINEAVPFNMEADSLNASIIGEDAIPGTEEFDLYIKEIQKEMTVKAGQKCTAIRRIIVPEKLVEDVQKALCDRLSKTIIGDPAIEGVRMGSLAGNSQVVEVSEKVNELAESQDIIYGDLENFVNDVSVGKTVICPMHPRTMKVYGHTKKKFMPNIKTVEPVGYFDILMLMKNTALIMTDSGGMQKEAYWLQVPCVTLREETEWVETVQSGWNVLYRNYNGLHKPSDKNTTYYGDGKAAERIVRTLITNIQVNK